MARDSNGPLRDVTAGRDPRLGVLTLVDHIGAAGGGERLALQVAARLDRARFRSVLCTSRTPVDRADSHLAQAVSELEQAGVELLELERTSPWQLHAWRPLVRRLRAGDIQILHCHKHASNVWGSAIGWTSRVPVIVSHEHTWSFRGQPLRKLRDRHVVARLSDVVVAVSEADRRRMIELEHLPAGKVEFIPNGILPAQAGDVAGTRKALGVGPDTPLIGAVGQLRPQKSFETLVEAAALLARRDRAPTVVIAGDGSERARLEGLIAQRDLQGSFRLLGYRADARELMAAFDVAVLSSSFEGTPLSVLEYMAAGRAIVATAVGGIPDLIEDGVHGRLVPPGSPELLAQALGEVLDDPALAAEMARRAGERGRSEFGLDATVQRVQELYERLYAAR